MLARRYPFRKSTATQKSRFGSAPFSITWLP